MPKKSVGPYDFTSRDLRLSSKVEGLAQVSTFEIFLSSDNFPPGTIAGNQVNSTRSPQCPNSGYGNLENSVAEGELQGIKRWLVENGFRRRDLFAWPRGLFTASQLPIARRFFSAIRGTTGGRGGGTGPQETLPPGDNRHLRTWTIGNETTAAEVETALAQCSTYKSWLILCFHKIVASGAKTGTECNEATFEEIIDTIAASGLTVKTIAEVLEG